MRARDYINYNLLTALAGDAGHMTSFGPGSPTGLVQWALLLSFFFFLSVTAGAATGSAVLQDA